MRHSYSWNDILVLPDDLRAFAWSAPMRDLATKLSLSDVGLKKLLASHGTTIAAAIVVAGERKFRRNLREAEEREERERIEQEKRKQEQLAELNRQRLQCLQTSGELLRQAQDIRALVERVRQAIVEGSADIDDPTLEAWESWALEEADRIDPICSGQVMSHIKEPTL